MKTGQKSQLCHHCGVTEAAFKTKKQFNEHCKEHFKSDKFSCDFCNKSFNKKIKLKNHKRFSHVSPVSSYICKVVFSNKEKLKKHMKNIHLRNVMSYVCEIFDKQFIYKEKLIDTLLHVKECTFKIISKSKSLLILLVPYATKILFLGNPFWFITNFMKIVKINVNSA